MICVKCNTVLPDDSICCNRCGYPVAADFSGTHSAARRVESLGSEEETKIKSVPKQKSSGLLLGIAAGALLVALIIVAVNLMPFVNQGAASQNTTLPPSPRPSISQNSNVMSRNNYNDVYPSAGRTSARIDTTDKNARCIIESGGKSINLKINCGSMDCDNDSATVAGKIDDHMIVIKTGRYVSSSLGFEWAEIKYYDETRYVASSKISCW